VEGIGSGGVLKLSVKNIQSETNVGCTKKRLGCRVQNGVFISLPRYDRGTYRYVYLSVLRNIVELYSSVPRNIQKPRKISYFSIVEGNYKLGNVVIRSCSSSRETALVAESVLLAKIVSL
jgi:hypothetical protein